MVDSPKGNGVSLVTVIPEWFLAFAGLVYATGFLIVFTHFQSFGIPETGAEFFKVKYVHAGILCTMFMILVGVPCHAYSLMWNIEREKKKEQKPTEGLAHMSAVAIVLNMLLAFYGLVMFAPRGYVQRRSFLIPTILLATTGFLLLMRFIESKVFVLVDKSSGQASSNLELHSIANAGRWVTAIIGIVILDWYSFQGLGPVLWEMLSGSGSFKTGGYVFVFFNIVMIFISWRVTKRVQRISERGLRVALWSITGCLLLSTFYLAVLSFAYSVYPYIPVDRGGGSLVDSPLLIMKFRADMSGFLPNDILRCSSTSCSESIPLVLIEETGSDVFVADPIERGGARKWRQGERPRVFDVRRELISALVVSNRTD